MEDLGELLYLFKDLAELLSAHVGATLPTS